MCGAASFPQVGFGLVWFAACFCTGFGNCKSPVLNSNICGQRLAVAHNQSEALDAWGKFQANVDIMALPPTRPVSYLQVGCGSKGLDRDQ